MKRILLLLIIIIGGISCQSIKEHRKHKQYKKWLKKGQNAGFADSSLVKADTVFKIDTVTLLKNVEGISDSAAQALIDSLNKSNPCDQTGYLTPQAETIIKWKTKEVVKETVRYVTKYPLIGRKTIKVGDSEVTAQLINGELYLSVSSRKFVINEPPASKGIPWWWLLVCFCVGFMVAAFIVKR